MTVLPQDQNQTARAGGREVGVYLALAFGLAWLLDLALYLTAGYGENVQTLTMLQAQMLTPALAAAFVLLFMQRDHPLYFRNGPFRPRWFMWFFLAFCGVFLVLALFSLAAPGLGGVISAISSIMALLGLLALIAVRGFSTGEAFAAAGLKGGRLRDWVFYGLAFVLFYAVQTALNWALNLGQRVDVGLLMESLAQQGGAPQMSPGVFLLVVGVQTVVLGPLIGLLFGFGEEYGWRGFLQGRLARLGRVRGVFLLGLIWGVWHYPVILMGHNYPGQPILGIIVMTGYTLALSFILGHVMFKTGSVWLVAFLHALNNQTLAFFNSIVYKPNDPIFSFGTGVFSLLVFIPVIWLLLRDPVWRAVEETEGMPGLG